MIADWKRHRPAESEHAIKLKAASMLAGRPVAASRGGKSKSALNKRARDAADVAAGAAEALNPKNVVAGLDTLAVGAQLL